MKYYTIVMIGFALVGSAALAAANPSLLPKHPGYPSGGEYANDTGRKNLTVEQSQQRRCVRGCAYGPEAGRSQ